MNTSVPDCPYLAAVSEEASATSPARRHSQRIVSEPWGDWLVGIRGGSSHTEPVMRQGKSVPSSPYHHSS
jgi:hypothetical protein